MPRALCAPLGRWVDPAAAYRAVCGNSDAAFWLDCGPGATTGTSYIGLASDVVTVFDRPVLQWLRASLAAERSDPAYAPTPAGFRLGWVGWLGYELRGETMSMPVDRASRYPDAAWLRIERAIAFDHSTGVVTVMAIDNVDGWHSEVLAALDAGALREAPATVEAADAINQPAASWTYADDEYLEMIAVGQRAIVEGDAYLLCLTTEVRVEGSPDPVETYLALRESSPTHHGGLLRAGAVSLLSASPEQFLTVSASGLVTTSPIKGTRPRGRTVAGDRQLRAELEANVKERAENVMIVDLMRNDIGRVCAPGTVGVDRLLDVESYAQVHQLVSTVRGELAEGLTGIDAVEACFPAGSMTGAPKRSAIELLDRLEHRARGIYSGAFGFIGFDGAIDLAMVIRSIVIDATGATVGTGGGITAMSVPEDELEEVKLKAAALLAALGVRDS